MSMPKRGKFNTVVYVIQYTNGRLLVSEQMPTYPGIYLQKKFAVSALEKMQKGSAKIARADLSISWRLKK